MNLPLDSETTIAVGCALTVALLIWAVAFGLRNSVRGRRLKRRLNAVHDRARGVSHCDWKALQKSSTSQNASTSRSNMVTSALVGQLISKIIDSQRVKHQKTHYRG
jgi:hypothetical protein